MTALVSQARQRVDRIRTLVGAARADIIESYRQRDWIELGYESWDALCAAEFGTVLRLSIEDRQHAAADLRGAGMSTRAIGSALGVSKDTVQRDLSSVSNETDEVQSLDGRKRPATRPRVEDDAPRNPEAEQVIADWIDSSDDVRQANLRAEFSRWMHSMHKAHLFDPAEIADVYPERADELAELIARIDDWTATYVTAVRHARLIIVKENHQ